MRDMLVSLVIGIVIGALGAWFVRDREMTRWRVEAGQERTRADSTARLADAWRDSSAAWEARAASLRPDTVVVTRFRVRVDTLAQTIAQAPTIDACRAAGLALVTTCQRGIDSVKAVIDSMYGVAAALTEGLTDARRADSSARADALRWRGLAERVPDPPAKWLGVFPRPHGLVGVGCAGGSGFSCGVIAGFGFTF